MMFVVVWCLVGVFVFSVMWAELLMTSAIICPLWSLVYEFVSESVYVDLSMRFLSLLLLGVCVVLVVLW